MAKILIVDDEIEMLNSLEKILHQRKSYDLELIQEGKKALSLVSQKKYDLIITDLKMKDVSGLDIVRGALMKFPESMIIVISGYGTIEASVKVMQEGAFDFLEKPFTSKKLFDCIDRAFSQMDGDQPHEPDEGAKKKESHGLIYRSQQMSDLIGLVHKIAAGNMNILITGESGTGKELIARAIHSLSKRNLNPFVPVNCGALPENLFESELFGHERGAFTGAVKTKPGLLEFANQGTFFFDEIGDLSLTLQVKLLRMLEDHQIRRVGGQREIEIDVRIIAATNKELSRAVQENKFREDLFYRLNTIPLEIPPLRDRRDDIMPLAQHFLVELCSKHDKPVQRFSDSARESMESYAWPGNVREIQNMISRAYFLCSSTIIQKEDLPLPVSAKSLTMDYNKLDLSYKDAKSYILEKFEVEYIQHHLKKNNGNISKTADACGLDRRSIHRLINKYGILYKK